MQKEILQSPHRVLMMLTLLVLSFSAPAKAADSENTLYDIPNITVFEDMGIPAPKQTFYTHDGKKITMQDLKGTPLIVNFWATWCPPCVKEMPSLIALEKILQPINGTRLITVSEDFGGISNVQRFIKQRKIDLPNPYVDRKNELMNAFGIEASLPTTVLVNKNGIIIARINGMLDGNSKKIQDILKQSF
jgi:thiol-disulfide isomerase/thioredoxin